MAGESESIKTKPEDTAAICNPDLLQIGEVPATTIAMNGKALPGIRKIGIGNTSLLQSTVELPISSGERIIRHTNINADIRFGGDRPRDRLSGYGGTGVRNSNTIDICVGRMGPSPHSVNKMNRKIFADNNFAKDSARLYISQRTDVDRNLNIKCELTEPAQNCSAVFFKADAVRIVARRDVRIVTGTDYDDSRGDVPSVDYAVPHKICLIGDNKDTLLQPMVKGENLYNFFAEILDNLHRILSLIDVFLSLQNSFNNIMANHVHITGIEGTPTPPSFDGITIAQGKTVQMVGTVKSGMLELIGKIEEAAVTYMDIPEDGVNQTNILSNYNFCN